MARKKPARRAATKAKTKPASRKPAKRVKKTGTVLKKAARKAAGVRAAATKKAKTIVRKARRSAAGIKAAATKRAKSTVVTAKAVRAGVKAALRPPAKPAKAAKTPNLDRPRKTVADIHGVPSSLGAVASSASAAKSGRAELKERLQRNTSASPALTAGDVDADWQSADAIGDEAPGGDNPTPDQDVVDEIGRALGVEYDDDEELQGGVEIARARSTPMGIRSELEGRFRRRGINVRRATALAVALKESDG